MPSRSALMTAVARAAHLEVDYPPYLFEDTLARRLLGDQADELLSYQRASGAHPILAGTRLAVTARSHYAERRLLEAAERDVAQYVILGAGLDSFAYRSSSSAPTVYEVDTPETSAWKQEVLSAAGIAIPDHVRFVPLDLARAPLLAGLQAHGFDVARPAFVSWLGVTMYLERSAIAGTLAEIGRFAPGSEVVVDHVLPESERDAGGAEYASLAESVGAANGEPWVTVFSIDEARALGTEAGLEVLAQPLLEAWVEPELWQRHDVLRPTRLWAMLHARVAGR